MTKRPSIGVTQSVYRCMVERLNLCSCILIQALSVELVFKICLTHNRGSAVLAVGVAEALAYRAIADAR